MKRSILVAMILLLFIHTLVADEIHMRTVWGVIQICNVWAVPVPNPSGFILYDRADGTSERIHMAKIDTLIICPFDSTQDSYEIYIFELSDKQKAIIDSWIQEMERLKSEASDEGTKKI